MLKPLMRCKVKHSTPLIQEGTIVTIDKESDKDGKPTVVIGKTGMIMAKVPNGGSLFFDESNLDAIL